MKKMRLETTSELLDWGRWLINKRIQLLLALLPFVYRICDVEAEPLETICYGESGSDLLGVDPAR